MKYRLGIIPVFISVFSLHTAPREPNRKYIEKTSQKRRCRGIQTAAAAAMCSVRNASENEIVVAGSIAIPSEGEIAGTGTGFSYIADAQTGTVVITFDALNSPTVSATAHDIDATRSVKITEQTEKTVTLCIVDFISGNPAVIEFSAIQFEQA